MNRITMLRDLRSTPSSQSPPIEADQIDHKHPPRPMLMWLIIAAAMTLVAFVAYALGSGMLMRADPVKPKLPPPSTKATAAEASALDASGYIVALRQATVSSRLTGRLVEVRIEEGQYVKRGEVIAVIDQRAATAALNETKAQYEQARAAVAQAQVRLQQQRRSTDRVLALRESGFVTKAAVDDAMSAAEASNLDLMIARQRLDAASAARLSSQISLEDSLVRAPFSGVVLAKAAEPGEIVSPVSAGGGFTRTGISTIVDLGSLEGEIEISERFVSRIHTAQAVDLIPTAYPSLTIKGCVIAVVPGVDRAKATLKVRVGLKSYDKRMLPNMAVRATFLDRVEPDCASGTK